MENTHKTAGKTAALSEGATETQKQREFILVEWIDKDNQYHSGVYPLEDKQEIESKLNDWLTSSEIKSYDISKVDDIIVGGN